MFRVQLGQSAPHVYTAKLSHLPEKLSERRRQAKCSIYVRTCVVQDLWLVRWSVVRLSGRRSTCPTDSAGAALGHVTGVSERESCELFPGRCQSRTWSSFPSSSWIRSGHFEPARNDKLAMRFLLSLTGLASLGSAQWVKGKAFDRFVTIWLENTDYDLAAGDPSLSSLAKKGIVLTNYFGVTHPSMPNYAASISGDYYGINHDDQIAIPSNVSTVVDLLEDKGVSWGEYQEDMPSVGFQGNYKNPRTGANMYVRKHNPAVLYDSVAKNQDRLAKTKPLSMFNDDLKANALPQWMFITPNMTSDGKKLATCHSSVYSSSQDTTQL